MRAKVLATNEQLSHDDSMVCRAAQGPNPPFGSRQGWRVDGKGLVLWVPGGGGLKTTHVGPVA